LLASWLSVFPTITFLVDEVICVLLYKAKAAT
jgi:hypothetical protein